MTYTEELLASGLPAVSYRVGVARWGLPNAVLRDDAPLIALFQRFHPDLAVVFVDDDRDGLWVAVLSSV